MKNIFDSIKELQACFAAESMGEANVEHAVEVDPYRNSSIGDILHELDLIQAHNMAVESLGETVRGNLCFYQDYEVASEEEGEIDENFSIEAIVEAKQAEYQEALNKETLESSFAVESIVNKVKRGAYNVKIKGKEIVQKVVVMIKGLYDQFMVADGKLKSYKKLIKKYREKLNTSIPDTKEDVEYTIRQYDYKAILKTWLDAAPVSIDTASIKSAESVGALVAATVETVSTSIIGKLPEKMRTGVNISGSATAETIQEIIKDKILVENAKDYINDIKESGETDTVSPTQAVSTLSTAASSVENMIEDRKYKKHLDKFIKDINSTLKKITKDKNKEVGSDTIESTQKVVALGALVVQYRTHVMSPWTKTVTSVLQALLADMAKVISKNTKVLNK